MKLIIGLGNPGDIYTLNRHNIGFMLVDFISKKCKINLSNLKFNSVYGRGIYLDNKIILVKSMDYINKTGIALSNFVKYFKLDISDLIVISDDVNIAFERIRIRNKGSAGGHNGLKSIISCLGRDDFVRIRVGVGMNAHGDLADYVLSDFKKSEQSRFTVIFDKVFDIINALFLKPIDKVLTQYNL